MMERARRLCRELGGPRANLWSLPTAAVERMERTGRSLEEATHDVVSGWLVVQARGGDRDAQEQLIRLWRGDVLRWCRWSAGRGVDPEDAAHEVLLRAITRLHKLDRPEGFRPWLWAIAWRVLREQERRPWLKRWIFGDEVERPCPRAGVEQALQRLERNQQIQDVLQSLALDDRTVLWAAYVDGRSRAQIGELYGWAEGTVNRKLTGARQRFRDEATQRGLAPSALRAVGHR